MIWVDAKTLGIKAKPFKEAIGYRRLTEEDSAIISNLEECKGAFPYLGRCSAGMHIDFKTDSREIWIRWSIGYGFHPTNLNFIGQSGFDIYVKYEGNYRFLCAGSPAPGKLNDNEVCVMNKNYYKIPQGMNSFSLNLCNYDECTKLEIGIDDNAEIYGETPFGEENIFVYACSITQGGCASRPGMSYTNIMRRWLNHEVVNFAFSGHGRLYHETTHILNRVEPRLLVMACIGNLRDNDPALAIDRYNYFYDIYRKNHPKVPILFIEVPTFTHSWAYHEDIEPINYVLRDIYAKWKDDNIYYLKCDDLYGHDYEATCDCYHPSDLGFYRMAEVITPVVKNILEK